MILDLAVCRSVLTRAVLAGLKHSHAKIESIPLIGPDFAEFRDVTAIAFDVFPWHRTLGIGLRNNDELHQDDAVRCNSGNWKLGDLINSSETQLPEFVEASQLIGDAYDTGHESGCPLEIAHLIFLAAAQALTSRDVTQLLQSHRIDAPFVADEFVTSRTFEYVVMDDDGVIRANYYDIVMSERALQRIRGVAKLD